MQVTFLLAKWAEQHKAEGTFSAEHAGLSVYGFPPDEQRSTVRVYAVFQACADVGDGGLHSRSFHVIDGNGQKVVDVKPEEFRLRDMPGFRVTEVMWMDVPTVDASYSCILTIDSDRTYTQDLRIVRADEEQLRKLRSGAK